MTPRRVLLVIAIALVHASTSASEALAMSPSLTLDRSEASVGETVRVQLHDWPPGPVALSVCGNNALRGDQDCALKATEAVSNTGAETLLDLQIVEPPATCPCVIRAFNAGNAVVRTVPIEIEGVATGPTVAPDPAAVQQVEASASIASARRGGLANLRAALGGRTDMILVLEVRNAGRLPVNGLTMTAAVGRDGQGGEPLRVPELPELAPGETSTLEIPFSVSAPAWGSYVAAGTIYGSGRPTTFTASASVTPWLLVLCIVGLAGTTVLALGLRARRRARIRHALRANHERLSSRRTLAEHAPIRADFGARAEDPLLGSP